MGNTKAESGRTLFALVLAAGSSSRFGASKQLQPFRGEALVRRAVRLAEASCGHNSLLVTGGNWREVAEAGKPLAGFLVRNDRFEQGLASSIACGVRAVSAAADAVLLLLADQPLISTEHLTNMIERWSAAPQRIFATGYAGTLGPPAIFPRSRFAELLALQGDHGARAVLQKNAATVVTIPFENAAIDVDTPADLAGISQHSD